VFSRGRFVKIAAAIVATPSVIAASDDREPLYRAQAIRDDLDFLWSALIDVGVEPFAATDRAIVEQMYRDTQRSIASDMTIRQAYLAIAPVLGALNDGHVGLGFPDPLNDAPHRFPLRFALTDGTDELVVARDRTGTIPIGSRIISVSGIPAENFVRTALSVNGGQTTALHRSRVTTSGAWPAVALFGARTAYDVVWASPDGARQTASIESGPSTSVTPPTPPYTYRTLHDGKIGFIDYVRCEDHDGVLQFIQTTCMAIHDAPVEALIIDVRRNGGGDSNVGTELWVNLSTKAFKQFGGMRVKSCDRLKSLYGRERYVSIYGQKAWDAPNGTIISYVSGPDKDLIVHPDDGDPAWYKGPIYLLIGTNTFSSAMQFALAAKDYGLATIVGEETGEPVIGTGEVFAATTPNLGLRAYLTTKVFLPPKPHPPRQGVVPDVIVPTTLADQAANRDPVLDEALRRILGSPKYVDSWFKNTY